MNNSLQLILLLVWKMDENHKNITPLLYNGLAWNFFIHCSRTTTIFKIIANSF